MDDEIMAEWQAVSMNDAIWGKSKGNWKYANAQSTFQDTDIDYEKLYPDKPWNVPF